MMKMPMGVKKMHPRYAMARNGEIASIPSFSMMMAMGRGAWLYAHITPLKGREMITIAHKSMQMVMNAGLPIIQAHIFAHL